MATATEPLTADDLQKLHNGEWWGIGHYQKTPIAELVRDSCRLIYTPEESK